MPPQHRNKKPTKFQAKVVKLEKKVDELFKKLNNTNDLVVEHSNNWVKTGKNLSTILMRENTVMALQRIINELLIANLDSIITSTVDHVDPETRLTNINISCLSLKQEFERLNDCMLNLKTSEDIVKQLLESKKEFDKKDEKKVEESPE